VQHVRPAFSAHVRFVVYDTPPPDLYPLSLHDALPISWVSIPSMPLIPAPIARSPAIRLSADTVRECTRPGQAQLLPCGQPARDAHAADRGRHEGGTPGGVPPSRTRPNDDRSDHSDGGAAAGASPRPAPSS